MATEFAPEIVSFGDSLELDRGAFELRRGGQAVRLERIPLELLLLLVDRRGQLVGREEIVASIWGKDPFLDTDNSINGAVRKIRQALHDDPETPRFIQTVTGRGYRFIAPIASRVAPAVMVEAFPEPAPPPVAPRIAAPRARWPRVAVAAAGLVFVGIALGMALHLGPFAPRATDPVTVAVLPLANLTGDPAQEFLSDGLTEELIAQLGSSDPRHVAVIARTSVMRYKNTSTPVNVIARSLHARYVLEGSVRRDGDVVRVTAQLVRADDEARVWTQQYDHRMTSVLGLQGDIASALVSRVRSTLTGTPPRLAESALPAAAPSGAPHGAAPAAVPAATPGAAPAHLTQQARSLLSARTPAALSPALLLRQATALDAHDAPAWAALSEASTRMSLSGVGSHRDLVSQARAAANTALSLDPLLAEAHTAQALVSQHFDYDGAQAEAQYLRALQLDPASATAHAGYASLLAGQGRVPAALAESARALAAAPLSSALAADHGLVLYLAGDFTHAAQALQRSIALGPTEPATALLIVTTVQQGRPDEALAQALAWYGADPGAWSSAALAYVYGRAGQEALAREALQALEDASSAAHGDPLPMRALALAGLPDRGPLLDTLGEAYGEQEGFLTNLAADPLYTPLHGDPRFEDLKHQVGLP